MLKSKLSILLFVLLTLNINILAQSRLIFNEALTTPPSDVNGDGLHSTLNDQFIEFINVSGISMDISGWKLSDENGLKHTFTAGTIIPAGGALVLFGGGTPAGTFGGAIVQVSSSQLNLNAGSGVIRLENSSDEIIDILDYGSEANQGQSIARDADITGNFVRHSTIAGAGGALFSPGLSNTDNSTHFPISTSVSATISGTVTTDLNSDSNINFGDKITYSVTISNNGSQSAKGLTLTNTVDGNTALTESSLKTTPLALEDYYITPYNTSLNIDQAKGVTGNDSDPDGSGSVTVISYGTTANPDSKTVPGTASATDLGGNVTVNANGSFTYNPPADQAGTDKFGYRIADSDNNIQPAVAEIKLYTISPSAAADTYTGTSGAALNIADGVTDLTSNDRLGVPAAAIVSFGGGSAGGSVTSNAANSTLNLGSGGSLKVNGNGSFDFTPNSGFMGTFTFSYRILSAGVTSDALVTIGVQQAPAASNDLVAGGSVPGNKYHGAKNTAITVNDGSDDLLSNDNLGFPGASITSFGGGSLGGSVTTNAAGTTANSASGSLTLNSDGTFVFTPALDFIGIFSFSYRISNILGYSDGTVQLASGIRPSAVSDTYAQTVTGNIRVNSAQNSNFSVLSNDSGDELELISSTVTSTQAAAKGLSDNVTLNVSTGTFTYNPPPGYEGSDSFNYTIQNGFGTSQGTVSITVSGMIWFVDNSAGSNGDGRLSSPFNSLSSINSINNGTGNNPAAGDNIFIYTGSGSYTGGLVLLNNQKLIGRGSTSTLAQSTGLTFSADSDPVPSTGDTNPVITNASGAGITLAQNNTVKGISLGTCSTYALSGSSVGTLNITDASITTSGQALSLTSGNVNCSFSALTSSGGTNNINLNSLSGSLTINSGALSGSTAASFVVIGGAGTITYNGNITQSNNASLIDISNHGSGTITFQSGTLSATNGNGIQFSNADGTYNFNGVTTLNGGDAGIDLLNSSNGTFTFSGNTTISNPSGIGFNLSSSSPVLVYNGSITKSSSGNIIKLLSMSSGSISFTGQLSSTGTSGGINISTCSGGTSTFSNSTKTFSTGANAAITCSSNTGHTMNFTNGGLSLTTANAAGLNVTGGGTINISGSNNTIASANGTALLIRNTTIGTSGLTFKSINSSGGSSTGIILDNTGSSGSLVITGSGTAGSGGTIASKSDSDGSADLGNGIYLNNTKGVSLSYMQLNDFGNFAIRGFNVNGLTLANVVINGTNGTNDALDEAAVAFNELTGTAAVTNSNISGGREDNFRVINTTGTLNRITFNSTTIGLNNTSYGNDGILIESQNTAVINVTVQNCNFSGARGDMIQTNLLGNSTMDLIFQNNTLVSGHPNTVSGGGGLTFSGGGSGSNITFTYDISGNTITGALGTALLVSKGSGSGSFSGKVYNNTIGNSAVANSGSSQGSAIYVGLLGGGSHSINVYNNFVYQFNNYGIYFQAGDALGTPAGSLNVRCAGNTISNPGSLATYGIHLNSGTVTNDAYNVCFNVTGNTVSGSGTGYTSHIRLRQRMLTAVTLPGYGGANNDNTAVANFIIGNNTFPGSTVTNAAAANTVSTGGRGFINGSACVTP